MRGKLHADSLYSAPIHGSRRISKELPGLSRNEVENIVDPRARELVKQRLLELGEPNPAKAFADPTNWPEVPGPRRTRLRRVRVAAAVKPRTVGTGARERHVGSTQGSNHHMVLWVKRDEAGKVVAVQMRPPVSMLEAYHRKRAGLSIVDRRTDSGWEFWFSIAVNDTIEIASKKDPSRRFVARIQSLSAGDIEVIAIDRATTESIDRDRIRSDKVWMTRNVRKVSVTPIGGVFRAGG